MKKIAVISAFIILTFGIIFYFIGYTLKWMTTDKLDNLFFYSICAGTSLLSYRLVNFLKGTERYFTRALSLYFLLLFILFGGDELKLLEFLDFKTKWVYVPTGGLVICLVLSVIWHLGRLRRST
jgi:hypothetical protein